MSSSTAVLPTPPKAKKEPTVVVFGAVDGENRGPNPMTSTRTKEDPFYWMRDDKRERADIVEYLEAENKYTEEMTSHLKEFHEQLYQEMKGFLKETDDTCPYPDGPYLWYSRTVEGLSYRINCRKPRTTQEEQIVLDENVVAEGLKFCDVGDISVSPKTFDLIAYGVDAVGKEVYNATIKRLSTGEVIDTIPETAGTLVFDNTEKYVYYTKQDASLRPYQLYRHTIKTPGQEAVPDECLLTEPDERFNLGVRRSRSDRFLIVKLQSKEASEVYYLDMDDANATLKCISPRKQGRLYSVDHHSSEFVITTNADGAENFKIVTAPVADPAAENWKPIPEFPYVASRKIDYCSCFANHLVVTGREAALTRIWVLDVKQNTQNSLEIASWHEVKFDEEVYTVSQSVNAEFNTPVFRFVYTSLTTPRTTMDYDVTKRTFQVMKTQEVPGYDRELYESKRFFVKAGGQDGKSPADVPVSMVYNKKLFANRTGPAPTLLYGYGSYGYSIDPTFDFKILPLLNRGVVFVIAHIRGGGEMGRYWYETEGKYLTKKNTFSDFIDVAKHLIAEGYTAPEKLAIEGRSAGGLLMGAVSNQAASLFNFVIAGVPFVDVLTTMADPTIPLTVTEWEEWGNPNEEKFHDYMKSYSPVDNVVAQNYPAMIITGGLHDPRVAYWEPAKWVAHLREKKTDNNTILLKIDMSAGHFSASDRYRYIRERSFDYVVMLDRLGLRGPPLTASL